MSSNSWRNKIFGYSYYLSNAIMFGCCGKNSIMTLVRIIFLLILLAPLLVRMGICGSLFALSKVRILNIDWFFQKCLFFINQLHGKLVGNFHFSYFPFFHQKFIKISIFNKNHNSMSYEHFLRKKAFFQKNFNF